MNKWLAKSCHDVFTAPQIEKSFVLSGLPTLSPTNKLEWSQAEIEQRNIIQRSTHTAQGDDQAVWSKDVAEAVDRFQRVMEAKQAEDAKADEDGANDDEEEPIRQRMDRGGKLMTTKEAIDAHMKKREEKQKEAADKQARQEQRKQAASIKQVQQAANRVRIDAKKAAAAKRKQDAPARHVGGPNKKQKMPAQQRTAAHQYCVWNCPLSHTDLMVECCGDSCVHAGFVHPQCMKEYGLSESRMEEIIQDDDDWMCPPCQDAKDEIELNGGGDD